MGSPNYQEGYAPVPEGFAETPFNDMETLKARADEDTVAIIIEPIQGEGGINMAEKSFLKAVRQVCDERNILLIFDEIQSGIARTGYWFAKDYYEVQPDIMTLAKGLGGGFPIGAVLCNEKVNETMHYGGHGTTFGGNPLAATAALTVLETIEKEKLIQAANEKGQWIKKQIEGINHPAITAVKGLGLMIGIEFSFETKELVAKLLENGLMANSTAGNIVRLVPPLNIMQDEINQAIKIFEQTLRNIEK
jgi:acetylornithine/N-succinyldiaminopimelate aminotransferase